MHSLISANNYQLHPKLPLWSGVDWEVWQLQWRLNFNATSLDQPVMLNLTEDFLCTYNCISEHPLVSREPTLVSKSVRDVIANNSVQFFYCLISFMETLEEIFHLNGFIEKSAVWASWLRASQGRIIVACARSNCDDAAERRNSAFGPYQNPYLIMWLPHVKRRQS